MTDTDRIDAAWLEWLGAKLVGETWRFNFERCHFGTGLWEVTLNTHAAYVKMKTESRARLLAVARALGVELGER